MLALATSATQALLSRLMLPYKKDIVLSEEQMRLMHIDPKNHPGFKGRTFLTLGADLLRQRSEEHFYSVRH